jgi:hypothetical protein
MSFQQLYDVLLAANMAKMSGKAHVYVKDGGAQRTATLSINNGEIWSIVYSQKNGKDALNELLSLAVENVLFMPQANIGESQGDTNVPDILSVLLDIEAKLAPDTLTKKFDLRKDVEELLKKIYGPGITKEIDKIANIYPPRQKPLAFLEQCKSKAMLMLSKDQVEKAFKAIYEKIQ